MKLDPELRSHLVCPVCRGELSHRDIGQVEGLPGEGEILACDPEGLAWPVVGGVPWLVMEKVHRLGPDVTAPR